jgi:hypothetical protein
MTKAFQDPFELQMLSAIAGLDNEKAELLSILKKYREYKRKYPITPATDNANYIPETNSIVIPAASKNYRVKGMPSIPDHYDKDRLTWDEKCLYALKELGVCFAENVIDKIKELEPDTPRVPTIKNAVTNKLSKMAIAGWINGKTGAQGRKTEYSLKDITN